MTDLSKIEWRPKIPAKKDYGIAHVGCGGIVQYAHMPAYQKAGFKIVGVYDINREAAQKVSDLYDNHPKVYESLDEALADPAVEIVDIAVPAWEQLKIVEKVAAVKKHMLCQKPLSDNFSDAVKIVELAKQAGVKQALQHQMRWDAGIAAAREMIKQGMIGIPTDAQIQVSCETPWHMWGWLAAIPRLEVTYHSIHYLDAMRSIFGNPEWVTSRHARYAEQAGVVGETKTIHILDYASGLQVLVAVNHYNIHGETYAVFRFIGTQGAIEGTIGLMYDYPNGRPDTLVYSQKGQEPQELILDEKWIPDAFVGPMASLMEAIQSDGTPFSDSLDNLDTLRVVNGAYLSAAENRSVRLSEIQG
jgi:predicted dehydrogenase